MKNALLSLFPGIDLFGRAFEAEDYHVYRGPDILFGQRIEDYHGQRGMFEGVIGGSPCQDFSRARRSPPTGEGVAAIAEFTRVVTEVFPEWWILENVPGVPDVTVQSYTTQRFNLNARDCGCPQNRLRCFQFGSLDGVGVVIDRLQPLAASFASCAMASEAGRPNRRDWATFCNLQGLPKDFDLPGWSLKSKYKAVGNGVPIPMGSVVAAAIRRRRATAKMKVCVCNCGRPVAGNAKHATAACRKRMERRRRDIAGVTGPGPDTPGQSRDGAV